MQDLKNNRIDVALLYDLDLSTDIDCVPLSEYSPYVALPNIQELAQKKEISLSELVDLRMRFF